MLSYRSFGVRHTHTQDVPDTTWVVKHGLNEFPAVNVICQYGEFYRVVIPRQLEYTNRNTITVRFLEPTLGIVQIC